MNFLLFRLATWTSLRIVAHLEVSTKPGEAHLRYANDSPRDSVHVFQIGLHHELNVQGISPSQQQKHFNVAMRRGGLHLVASPHASTDSIRLYQNVYVYSAILKEGRHVVHELSAGRLAWVQVVQGKVRLLDSILASGDGCGVTQMRAVALTAYADSEVLLFDVCGPPPSFANKNAHGGDASLGGGADRRVMAVERRHLVDRTPSRTGDRSFTIRRRSRA